jgi:hypothetical protein
MPGGFGTMDELFETCTLIQTKTIRNFPIVVYGQAYHEPLRGFFEKMIAEKTISTEDMHLVLFTDNVQEGVEHIRTYLKTNYYKKPLPPSWWLFERRNFLKKYSGNSSTVANLSKSNRPTDTPR